MVDQHVLLEWSLGQGNLFINMITTNHLAQLENIEGDFLFIIDTDLNPATAAFNSAKEIGGQKRIYRIHCTEDSKQWNKVRDLGNNVLNYLGNTSSVVKGGVINELKNLNTLFALVYVDAVSNLKEVLDQVHTKLPQGGKVIVKSVDTSLINDYITLNNLKSPTVLQGGYMSYTNKKESFILNKKVSRTKSNNF